MFNLCRINPRHEDRNPSPPELLHLQDAAANICVLPKLPRPNAPPSSSPKCQAVRAGNTIYVRGQIGTDFEGNLVGLGDPRAQAEQAMKNVKQLLEEAGSDLSHIVKTTTYLIDPRYREPVYQEVGKWLKGVFPISTGLVVSALGQPQWLMEIDVIAVIPE